jgi:hypothetical protein
MDLQPIKSLIENRGQPWSLTFYPRKNDPRSARLEAFLQELNREAGIAWTVTNPPDAVITIFRLRRCGYRCG